MDAEKGLDAKTQLPLLQRLDLCLWSPESDIRGEPGQLMGSGSGFVVLISASAVHTGVGLSRPLNCMHSYLQLNELGDFWWDTLVENSGPLL